MDAKTFKSDIVYAIKTLLKTGASLTLDGDNLDIDHGNLKLVGSVFDPLEALLLVKRPKLYIQESVFDSETGIRTLLLPEESLHYSHPMNGIYVWDNNIMYNVYLPGVIADAFHIEDSNVFHFLNGYCGKVASGLEAKNDFYKVGIYIRDKFLVTGYVKEC